MRSVIILLVNHRYTSNTKNQTWIEGLFKSDHVQYPSSNSWRINCSSYLSSGDDSEDIETNYCNRMKPWYLFPNVVLRSEDFCWSCQNDNKSKYDTNVMAIIGPDTAYDIRDIGLLKDCNELIVLIEVNDTGIHWAQDGDISVESISESITLGSDGDGVTITFLDGTVWFLDKSVPLETLQHFFTAQEARTHKRDIELKPYKILGFDVLK